MIDLHIHSSYSDGSYDPIEILKMANDLELQCISITDHNTVEAYKSLENVDIKKLYKGNLINGCEISCMLDNVSVEVLGYYVDIDLISNWLHKYFSKQAILSIQNKRLNKLKRICKEQGLVFDENITIMDTKRAYTLVMRSELIKYKENRKILNLEVWENTASFRKLYCWNPDSPLFIDESEGKPTLQEVARVIKEAGGLSFLAHAYEYTIEDEEKFLLSVITEGNLDGIECFHSSFTQQQTDYLLSLCQKKGCYISGGTDFHGALKPNIQLGKGRGELNISFDFIKEWCS